MITKTKQLTRDQLLALPISKKFGWKFGRTKPCVNRPRCRGYFMYHSELRAYGCPACKAIVTLEVARQSIDEQVNQVLTEMIAEGELSPPIVPVDLLCAPPSAD